MKDTTVRVTLIEREAGNAVARQDARWWGRWKVAIKRAEETRDTRLYIKLTDDAEDARVTTGYERLLVNLRRGEITGNDFKKRRGY